VIRTCGGSRGRAARTSARAAVCAALCLVSLFAHSQDSRTAQPAASVLQAWLAYPGVDTIEWPYAYLRTERTQSVQQTKRTDLFKELDHLTWRLENARRDGLLSAIGQWRGRLEAQKVYRQPGDWSPAWLMAHPHRSPPLARVAAIGACEPPDWVEVWDSTGVERTPWRSGLQLSDLSRRDGPLQLRSVDQVALITPEGEIKHYGQAPFNYSDAGVSPGTRVVAALPLGGEAFPWIRDAIANLLAHSPVGSACREMELNEKESQDD